MVKVMVPVVLALAALGIFGSTNSATALDLTTEVSAEAGIR